MAYMLPGNTGTKADRIAGGTSCGVSESRLNQLLNYRACRETHTFLLTQAGDTHLRKMISRP